MTANVIAIARGEPCARSARRSASAEQLDRLAKLSPGWGYQDSAEDTRPATSGAPASISATPGSGTSSSSSAQSASRGTSASTPAEW